MTGQKNYDNVGVVHCVNNCFLPLKEKKKQLDIVKETYGFFWGYCIDRQTYNAIKNLINEYEQLFLINWPQDQPNCPAIGRWMEYHLNRHTKITHNKPFKSILNYRDIFKARIRSLKKRGLTSVE